MSHDPTVVLGPLVKQDHVDLQSNVQSKITCCYIHLHTTFFLVFCHCHFVLCYLLLPKLPTNVLSVNTDYGRPMKPFFIKIPNFWAWADNLDGLIFGHLGYS